MRKDRFFQMEKQLFEIVDVLLLNGTLVESPGLLYGKMGIAIFFFHYSKFTNNELFADYAMDLIDKILNQIHINSPVDYANGLAGIGVGIDYLIQNNFLAVEGDVCDDFDQKMYNAILYESCFDASMYNGLCGYGRYWITRLKFQDSAPIAYKALCCIVEQIEENFSKMTVLEQFDSFRLLNALQTYPNFEKLSLLLEKYLKESRISIESLGVLKEYTLENVARIYQYKKHFSDDVCIVDYDISKRISNVEWSSFVNLGLLSGLSGEAMLLLVALKSNNIFWLDLLS